jgi:mannosyltransferase OCH1-like enzyme
MRKRRNLIRIFAIATIIVLLITCTRQYGTRYSPPQMVNELDVTRFGNATWPRRRIPRLIHQTWHTHEIPLQWNASVQSVISYNRGEFKYHLWTDTEMDEFVRHHESHFYTNTFITYRHQIQCVDAFRYVLLLHLRAA